MRARILLAAVILGAPAFLVGGASASEPSRVDPLGPYIALGLGASVTPHEADPGPSASASLGYAFGNGLRLEVQGVHTSADSARDQGGYLQVEGAFANVLYDIDLKGGLDHVLGGHLAPLTPYVGAGVGYEWLRRSGGGLATAEDGGFAAQGMLGASYALAAVPGMSLTAEYRATGVPGEIRLRGEHADRALSHSGYLGLRYAFGGSAPSAVPAAHDAAAAGKAPSAVRTFLVFFDWDKADLTDRARAIVGQAADASKAGGATRVEVTGHADRSGSAEYNLSLSRKRGELVAAELVLQGVSKTLISVTADGETKPLVPTADGVREPQNRRVEIVVR